MKKNLVVFLILLFSCQPSNNITPDNNNTAALEWGKQHLISTISLDSVENYSQLISNLNVRIKSDEIDLPQKACKPEGYHISIEQGKISVTGFDAAGAMYGCLELSNLIKQMGRVPETFELADAPILKLRGTCILLMKLGTYNYPITPKTFPFFYDKNLWLDYLNFLADNRYNYIAFWNGHPFDYFVKLEKYPEAQSGMEQELIEKNNKMLTWLCEEGRKRNIRFLFQFYNIHTSVYFQKAHNLPDQISKPSPLLEDYTSYTIETFVKAFPQVGLYITPGEAIDIEYTDSWINEVIFPAIRRTGKSPPVFVRSWGFDLDHARKIVDQYPNLYFERKFNVEMIADTISDPENRLWADLNGNFIVNIHMAANLEPFRWNPPTYIQKCMQNAHKNGSNGLHLYPRKSWRWPYGSDIDISKLQWERDALWFESWGRYAWDPYRDLEGEKIYWQHRLTTKFGNPDAAQNFLLSFETAADVLPALQRLFWLGHDNHTVLSAGAKVSQLERAEGIPFLPLKDVMRIPQFLQSINMRNTDNRVNTIDYLEEKCAAGKKSYLQAKKAAGLASKNQSEARSYENDALLTSLTADFYTHKLKAVKFKILYENNHDPEKNRQEFLVHLKSSLNIFRQMTSITEATYESLSDVPAKHPEKLKICPYHWRDILPLYEREYEIYEMEGKTILDDSFFEPSLEGLAGIWYGDPGLKNPDHSYTTSQIKFDWSNNSDDFGRNWSAHWFGFLMPIESGKVIMESESDRGVVVKSGKKILQSWSDTEGKKSVQLDLTRDIPFPIEIIYDHAGGDEGYLKITWFRIDQAKREPAKIQFSHSPAQSQKMDRISILNQ